MSSDSTKQLVRRMKWHSTHNALYGCVSSAEHILFITVHYICVLYEYAVREKR